MTDGTTLTTPKKRWVTKFLSALAQYGNVSRAALYAGIERSTAYDERHANPEFADDWEYALELGTSGLEDEAKRRAFEGVKKEKPIYVRGKLAHTLVETEYSDTLLIFLLKAHRPDKYRETVNQRHTFSPADASQLTDDALDAELTKRGLA